MSARYVKKPCAYCPFRKDVQPFLHPERALEIAFSRVFLCHKTIDYDLEEDDGEHCHGVNGEPPKLCAGALSMDYNASHGAPEGFKPSPGCYEDAAEMITAYQEVWTKTRGVA